MGSEYLRDDFLFTVAGFIGLIDGERLRRSLITSLPVCPSLSPSCCRDFSGPMASILVSLSPFSCQYPAKVDPDSQPLASRSPICGLGQCRAGLTAASPLPGSAQGASVARLRTPGGSRELREVEKLVCWLAEVGSCSVRPSPCPGIPAAADGLGPGWKERAV